MFPKHVVRLPTRALAVILQFFVPSLLNKLYGPRPELVSTLNEVTDARVHDTHDAGGN